MIVELTVPDRITAPGGVNIFASANIERQMKFETQPVGFGAGPDGSDKYHDRSNGVEIIPLG